MPSRRHPSSTQALTSTRRGQRSRLSRQVRQGSRPNVRGARVRSTCSGLEPKAVCSGELVSNALVSRGPQVRDEHLHRRLVRAVAVGSAACRQATARPRAQSTTGASRKPAPRSGRETTAGPGRHTSARAGREATAWTSGHPTARAGRHTSTGPGRHPTARTSGHTSTRAGGEASTGASRAIPGPCVLNHGLILSVPCDSYAWRWLTHESTSSSTVALATRAAKAKVG